MKNQWRRILEINEVIENEEKNNNTNKFVEDMNTFTEGQQHRSPLLHPLHCEEMHPVLFLEKVHQN